ncbi:copper resistance CopC family protein [Ruegeria atlantica]|uniref:Copper resistance protein C n=1 Tax=Ruegeria atlantica TaxID=81569 RepID=A0A0P1EI41_9RHOB|nr:copper resistance CopC family protein [Ruegeria atlantica]CUH49763.1 Copper resistance protein C precursor [Ruegeria atlantica]
MIKQTLFGLAVAMGPVLAAAHSKSEETMPADGATVTDVPELTMRFDDPMRIISVTLTSPDGDVKIERETGMDPTTEFRAMPLEELAPGSYRFDWRGMASDGHPMQGSFSFTVVQ